ncbi:MAG: hypothetical protein ALECFALPRED_004224 [Alectoria fallacina]|uniref:Uncharacterized protein n=1 Tax=Alectoria fallacina TaxID=1903189 RepID=A0A8H3EJ43_9LECA|nr:MAG: hypothetical protein ALECFALPRED_004224 [Alectoria fallacina]
MTSPFARNQQFSQQTLAAFRQSPRLASDVTERLAFFCAYLEDVAPSGLVVQHVPVELDNEEQDSARNPRREEIQLVTESGMIFMSGIVSMEVAGDEAYTKWPEGGFTTPDGNNWRFFTGHNNKFRFFSSYRGGEWESTGEFHPIQKAEEVAAFLQQEFDRLPLHGRH